MKDEDKTEEQLVKELGELRQRIAELEASETERKRAEEALRESEELFRQFFENEPEYCYMISPEGVILDVNGAALKALGYKKEELVGKPLKTIYAPESLPRMKQLLVKWKETGELRDEEMVIITKEGDTRTVLLSASVVRDKDGRVLHSVSVQRDITERKRADNLIRTQRDLGLALSAAPGLDEGLRLCVEAAFHVSEMDCGGVYLVDETSAGLELVFHKGLSPDLVRSASHYDADLDNARLVMAGKPIYTEHRELGVPLDEVRRRENLRAIAVIPMHDEDRVIGCLNIASRTLDEVPIFSRVALEGIATQIGSAIARLRAEEALRASEERFRQMAELSPFPVSMVDLAGRYEYVNPKFIEVFGYTLEDIPSGREWFARAYPDPAYRQEVISAWLSDLETFGEYEVRPRMFSVTCKDGTVREVLFRPVTMKGGRQFVIHEDITERKQAEEALRHSEERLDLVLKAADLGIWDRNIQTGDVVRNERAAEIYGHSLEEMERNVDWWESRIHPDDRPRVIETRNRHLEGMLPLYEAEYRLQHRSGEWRWIQSRGKVVERDKDGIPLRITGTFLDVTERKRAEEALRESEERYRRLVELSFDGIAIHSEAKVVFTNPAGAELLGARDPKEIVGKLMADFVHPDYRDFVSERLQQVRKGSGATLVEERFIRLDGTVLDVEVAGIPITYQNKPAGQVVFRDITERKRAEEALHRSEARNRAILGAIPDLMFQINEDGTFLDYKAARVDELAVPPSEFLGRKVYEVMPTEFAQQVMHYVQRALQTGEIQAFEYQLPVPLPDGDTRDYEARFVVSGEDEVLTIVRDITERKQAEERIRFLAEVLSSSPLSVVATDREGKIIYVNPATEELFGYGSDELLGKDPAIFNADPNVDKMQKEVLDTVLQGEVWKGEILNRKKNGDLFPIQASVYQLLNEERNIIALVGFQEDITERKRTEESLRRQTEQLDALHQVGLQLTTQLDLDALLRSIVARAIELVRGTSGGLYLYQPERDVLEWTVAIGRNLAPIGTVLHRGEGVSGRVWESGEPFIVDDYQHWDGRAATYESHPFKAVIGVPIHWGEEFLGVLNVLADAPRTFSLADLELLSLFATQAAIAIRNARLYELERQRTAELARSNALIAALSQVAARLQASYDPDQVMETLGTELRRLNVNCIVAVLKPDSQTAVVRYISTESAALTMIEKLTRLKLRGLRVPRLPIYEELVEQGRAVFAPSLMPLVAAALPGVPRPVLERALRLDGARPDTPAFYLPLAVEGRVLGVLNMVGEDLREDDLAAVSIFASQVAMALENARLYEQVQRHAEELEQRVADRTRELSVLYEVAAVASQPLDLQTTLEQVLERGLRAMRSDMGGIHLLDEEGKTLHLVVEQGVSPDLVARREAVPVGSGLLGQVIEHGQPRFSPDVATDPRVVMDAFQSGLGPYIGVPIRARGQTVGVLSVLREAAQPQFTAEEVTLLTSIADQVGAVVESARLRGLAEQAVVVEERGRLARELHDSVTQSLYSVTLLAETGRRSAQAGELEGVASYLGRLGEVAQQALKEMRLLIYELRPPALEREGLAGALQQRLDAVEGRAGVEARLLVEGEGRLAAPVEEALYRIALEALNNALKHAAATSVTVRIRADRERAELEVADNGRGFDPQAVRDTGGMGLVTMRERAQGLGGTLTILSAPGEGTRVKVSIGAHRSLHE